MRLVIAEGSAVLRAGLAHVLGERGHQLAGAVHDARALPALVATHRPDVLVANVRLARPGPTRAWAPRSTPAGGTRHRRPAVLREPEPQHVARLFAGDAASAI
ncbi:hypothetical protein STENM36S_09366 [Streptomyces tendae]